MATIRQHLHETHARLGEHHVARAKFHKAMAAHHSRLADHHAKADMQDDADAHREISELHKGMAEEHSAMAEHHLAACKELADAAKSADALDLEKLAPLPQGLSAVAPEQPRPKFRPVVRAGSPPMQEMPIVAPGLEYFSKIEDD